MAGDFQRIQMAIDVLDEQFQKKCFVSFPLAIFFEDIVGAHGQRSSFSRPIDTLSTILLNHLFSDSIL